jgi:hypothetical protein
LSTALKVAALGIARMTRSGDSGQRAASRHRVFERRRNRRQAIQKLTFLEIIEIAFTAARYTTCEDDP